MAQNVIMPKTGMAMEEGTVVQWLKKVGDLVTRGEVIAVIETDKVTMDLESEYDGTLLEIVHGDGDVVAATSTIAWIGQPGETPAAPPPALPPAAPAGTSRTEAATPAAPPPPQAPAGPFRTVAATPAARAHAARLGIGISTVAGTGPDGAVCLRDVQGFSPMSAMRKAIADKMRHSHEQVPAVTIITRADVTDLAEARRKMASEGGERVSFTDFILRAAGTALREHPLINSLVVDGRTTPCEEVNVGIAVALQDGLVVPVIHGVDRLTVRQIADARRELLERARSGKLQPADCTGGTFTVTNLGMYGVTEFTPLINIPESAILGIGAIEETLRMGPSGIEQRKIMSLCLTHDHRHIDGAPAAVFLGRIRGLLESAGPLDA